MSKRITSSSSSSGEPNVNIVANEAIEKVLEKFEMQPEEPNKPSIFKIPEIFRAVSAYDNAYTPCRVAIGPYHAKNSDLKLMQLYKIRFVTKLLSYFSDRLRIDKQLFRNKFAETLLRPENIREAQNYYTGIGDDRVMNSDSSFPEMLLVDGAFIVGFLCKYVNSPKHFNITDELTAREKREILRDILLLENQFPFFILDQSFKFFFPTAEHHFSYIAYLGIRHLVPVDRDTKLSEDKVRNICFTGDPSRLNNEDSTRNRGHHIRHLLHLMTICCLPSQQFIRDYKIIKISSVEATTTLQSHPFRSVTELHEAGVRFKRIERNRRNQRLLVDFNKGVLEMPRLTLDEFTESIFRNMVAFELYYLDTVAITSYVHFMDHLIDTPNDVKILEKCDLIENWLESKGHVTTIFNCISKHTLNHYQFPLHYNVSREMKDYIHKRMNRWMARLYRDYFGNPWLVISFCAAVFLLGLTIIQALTSLRQVNWI